MTAMYFDARIDGTQLQRDVANINKQISLISTHMKKEGSEIDAITRRIGTGLTGAFSVFAVGGLIKDIARVRGEYQQLDVALETMLGNKSKADKLMAEVVQFAAKTPFELGDVASGAKQLLAYGIAAEDIIPTLKSLGDVSAGLSVPIERLILNYGQVRTQLKMTGRELRDFQVAGVPIVAELAKQLNVAEKQVQDMVSAGEIGFAEVEKAFRSMTDEGGRFNNLMDKQAETITGLASNFSDAWDKMLNSIGQQNEGVIAGSIKGAIELVENYEEVLKILKILVATYGTYKAAVIAAGVATRVSAQYGIYDIATKKLQAAATLKAAAAQTALNTAAKANPYGLIIAGVTALISALTLFGRETKKTEDYINDLNESIESLGSQTNVDNLIGKYDNLKNKTNKTEAEQNELNKTIAELGKLFPEVITKTDNYGNAIDIAREKLVELNDELRKNVQLSTEKKIEDAENKLNELYIKRGKILKEIETGRSDPTLSEYQMVGRSLDTKEIEKRREEVNTLSQDIDKLGLTIKESENKLQTIGQIDAEKALEPYKNLFGDVSKYSEQEALKIKAALVNLLSLGLGREAESKIKDEIGRISQQLALPTVREQIKKATDDLKRAKAELDSMREEGSASTSEDISLKESEIKDLEKTLETLTGIKKADQKKALEEQKKAKQKQLEVDEEYASRQLELERSLQASIIAAKKDGQQRQLDEADLAYKQELDRINRQQEEYLKALNAQKGFEPGDKEYITEMPEADLQKFDQMRINAEQVKNNKVEQINKDASDRIKAIWSDVNDVFLSDSEAEIKAINDKYDTLIARAKEAGKDITKEANRARDFEINESTINSGLQRLQFEEDIEMHRAEISTQGFNREVLVEKKKMEIAKKYAQLKINMLKLSGKDENKQEIEQLQLFIDAADKGLKDLDKKTLADSLSKISQMVDEMKAFSDEVFGADSQLSNVLGGLGEMGTSLARIAAGDYSGAVSLISSMYKMAMDTSATENRLSRPWEDFEKWVAASNRELERYISLRDDAIGADRYTATDQVIDETLEKIGKAEQMLSDLQLSFTFKSSGWFNSAYKEVEKQAEELMQKLGAELVFEDYAEWGVGFWKNVKGVYSLDLDKLLFDEAGTFTISKINNLIDEGLITDQKVIEAVNYYEQLATQLAEAEKQKQELLTATMAGNIADGIVDGFSQGYNSAADFADSFEQLMKNAILNAVKIQTLEEPLREWYRQFADASESGNILTSEEIAQIEDSYNTIIEAAQKRFEEMKRISGLNFDSEINRQGLTGAVKGITEETAGLIAGQFMAFRELQSKTWITAQEQLDSINQTVGILGKIEQNTRHNAKLNDIDSKLGEMNQTLKQGLL